jgi:hypothetical protein
MYNNEPGQIISVSDFARHAPANFASLPSVETHDDGQSSTSVGCGMPSKLKCEACGHGGKDLPDSEKNHRIYFYTNRERNGNYSTRSEILCKMCGKYSVIETWEEG